jgi:hypothetical protein
MSRKTKIVGLVATAALIVTGVTIGITGNETTSIDRTYSAGQCSKGFCYTCNTPVDLDEVNIVIDENVVRVDGVKFAAGCTGHIHSFNVTTSSSDALKVAEGAHDLVIDGGTIKCLDKLPTLHQDAIQVMGGSNITFNNMTLDCGRADDDLIDSNFFVNLSGTSTVAPDHVVCDSCSLGKDTAHTVNLQTSSDSGVRNSTICEGKFPRLSFTKGVDAVNIVDENNTIQAC